MERGEGEEGVGDGEVYRLRKIKSCAPPRSTNEQKNSVTTEDRFKEECEAWSSQKNRCRKGTPRDQWVGSKLGRAGQNLTVACTEKQKSSSLGEFRCAEQVTKIGSRQRKISRNVHTATDKHRSSSDQMAASLNAQNDTTSSGMMSRARFVA